jgi:hypothetical protein
MECGGGASSSASLFSSVFPAAGEEATEVLSDSGVCIPLAAHCAITRDITRAAGLRLRHGSSLSLMLAAAQFLTDSDEFRRSALPNAQGVTSCHTPHAEWTRRRTGRSGALAAQHFPCKLPPSLDAAATAADASNPSISVLMPPRRYYVMLFCDEQPVAALRCGYQLHSAASTHAAAGLCWTGLQVPPPALLSSPRMCRVLSSITPSRRHRTAAR